MSPVALCESDGVPAPPGPTSRALEWCLRTACPLSARVALLLLVHLDSTDAPIGASACASMRQLSRDTESCRSIGIENVGR